MPTFLRRQVILQCQKVNSSIKLLHIFWKLLSILNISTVFPAQLRNVMWLNDQANSFLRGSTKIEKYLRYHLEKYVSWIIKQMLRLWLLIQAKFNNRRRIICFNILETNLSYGLWNNKRNYRKWKKKSYARNFQKTKKNKKKVITFFRNDAYKSIFNERFLYLLMLANGPYSFWQLTLFDKPKCHQLFPLNLIKIMQLILCAF